MVVCMDVIDIDVVFPMNTYVCTNIVTMLLCLPETTSLSLWDSGTYLSVIIVSILLGNLVGKLYSMKWCRELIEELWELSNEYNVFGRTIRKLREYFVPFFRFPRLSMEQIKAQIDQMLDLLKQRSAGQSRSELFEMIGKLEQAKYCLFAEAMCAELPTFGPPPPDFFDNLPLEAHVADGQQVVQIPQTEVGGSQQVIQIPHAAPVGDASGWKYVWDPSDEHHFLPISDPVHWFTTSLEEEEDRKFLHITDDDKKILNGGSPPQSFINSKMFLRGGMPVTLKSSMLAGSRTYRTGLLVTTREGIGLGLRWSLLGSLFPLHTTIELSFQWKMLGEKHTLLIFINEKVSEQMGTSKQATGRKRNYAD